MWRVQLKICIKKAKEKEAQKSEHKWKHEEETKLLRNKEAEEPSVMEC